MQCVYFSLHTKIKGESQPIYACVVSTAGIATHKKEPACQDMHVFMYMYINDLRETAVCMDSEKGGMASRYLE